MGEIINVNDYMKNKGIDILNSIHANGFKTEYEKQIAGHDNPDYSDPFVSMDYTYFVNDTLDISNSTHLIYPHGGDIWGNIYDWKRVDSK